MDFGKASALVKYVRGDGQRGASLEAMGYDGHWRSTDQVALRAVHAGLISRFGAIDPSDGRRPLCHQLQRVRLPEVLTLRFTSG